jgi:hypothetical protein
MRGRITRNPANVAGITGNFAAARRRTWQKGGGTGSYARYPRCYTRYFRGANGGMTFPRIVVPL